VRPFVHRHTGLPRAVDPRSVASRPLRPSSRCSRRRWSLPSSAEVVRVPGEAPRQIRDRRRMRDARDPPFCRVPDALALTILACTDQVDLAEQTWWEPSRCPVMQEKVRCVRVCLCASSHKSQANQIYADYVFRHIRVRRRMPMNRLWVYAGRVGRLGAGLAGMIQSITRKMESSPRGLA
jgi:hypothetical protein